jgi:hypothetical protein
MSTQTPGPNDSSINPGAVVPALRFREALAAIRPELEAVRSDDFVTLNFDLPSAVITVLGCIPGLRELQPRIEALSEFDAAQYARVETYALAASQAHTQYQAASRPIVPIAELTAELATKRDLFLTDIQALVKRNYLDGSRLAELKGTTGSKNIAYDVMLLVAMLRDSWATVGSKTAVAVAELDDAERKADSLATALGLKEQAEQKKGDAYNTRMAALTLFVNAYDQAQRAVTYLRWNEGDAERIAPTLYGSRNRKSAKPVDPDATLPGPAPLPAPAAGNGGAAPGNGAPVVVSPTSPTAQNVAGMPGNEPFGNS